MSKLFVTALVCILVCTACLDQTFNVKNFGAEGIKSQDATLPIQRAIDRCSRYGGGTVYFPPGEYTSGFILLRDNVTIELEAGATLFASKDTNDYKTRLKIIKKYDVERGEEKTLAIPLLYAKEVENIGITGKGVINGQAESVYKRIRETDKSINNYTEAARKSNIEMKRYYKVKPYVNLVFFENCKNIRVDNVSLIESCDWSLFFKWCKNVFIDNLNVFTSLEKGVDAAGIVIDGCEDVIIDNCNIKTGDDAIAFKTTITEYKTMRCQNIAVNNSLLTSTSSAIKIGAESYADFRYIGFNNCIIRNSNRGLGIVIRDGGTAENIHFSNITMELNRKHFNWRGNAEPFSLLLDKRYPSSRLGAIKNITFSNITAHVQGTSRIKGYNSDSLAKPLENIKFDNVQVFMNAETTADKRTDDAFYAQDVNGLNLKEFEITWDKGDYQNKWNNAFTFFNVEGLYLNNVRAKQAPTNKGVFIECRDVQHAWIENCKSKQGTNVFLKVCGKASNNVYLNDNYFKGVLQEIVYCDGAGSSIINTKEPYFDSMQQ
jgi:polygalacturonase